MLQPHNLWSISTDPFARNWLRRTSLNARRFWPMERTLYTERFQGRGESIAHFPSEVDPISHFVSKPEPMFSLPSEICCEKPRNPCGLRTGDLGAKHSSGFHVIYRFTDHCFLQFWILLLILGSWQRAVAELCVLQLSRKPAVIVFLQCFVCIAFLGLGSGAVTWKVGGTCTPLCVCVCAGGSERAPPPW